MTLTAFNGEPVVWDSSLEDKLSTKFGFLARRVEKQVRNKDEKIKDYTYLTSLKVATRFSPGAGRNPASGQCGLQICRGLPIFPDSGWVDEAWGKKLVG